MGTKVILSALLIIAFGCNQSSDREPKTDNPTPGKTTSLTQKDALFPYKLEYRVVNSYPHDPGAFLQGLIWHNGTFYESTGRYGHSTLRRVEWKTGKVLQSKKLDSNRFGEGLTMVGDKLIQLTYRSKLGFVYDLNTFEKIREFSYPTEGWGLTYDGHNLIMSDGTDKLFFLSPESFEITGNISVKFNGSPVIYLNELEYIRGEVWANIFNSTVIVQIDPISGKVGSYIDMGNLPEIKSRSGLTGVLNGIAYNADEDRLFISGKLWPHIYEIKLN